MKLLIRWVIAALAIFAAVYFIPGIRVADPNAWMVYGIVALVLGLVNAIIRPILSLLSCPFIILTLGLGLLLINGLSFLIAARIAEGLGVGFFVDDYWSAFLGALIVSFISVILNSIIKDRDRAISS